MKHSTRTRSREVRKHAFTRLTTKLAVMILFGVFLLAVPLHAALAQTAPDLSPAGNFSVLAGTAVTCTDSIIVGDVGVSPGTAITQTNCTINGTAHANDPAAIAANAAFFSAYDALANNYECTGTLDTVYTGATVTLTPGVYCNTAGVTFTNTTLTLDAQGNANAVWIFKIGTGGTGALTGTGLSVVMANGGQPCNVYWWTAEAATMTTSLFLGNLLAGAATTATGGSFTGRDFAKAAVTLSGANVFGCSSITPPVCRDFVTGGGWIMGPSGGKATFALSGGIRHGEFWGHLTYLEHYQKGSKMKDLNVKGTGVTAYAAVDATTRHIEGTAEINGQAGYTYQVDVMDSGEPGRDDMFSLRLSNGYTASGTLDGGNIQLHKECRPLICGRSDKEDEGEGHGDHDGQKDHDGRD